MIELKAVCFRYPNSETDSLKETNLEFALGSFTAVMGSNGSGKSTLARLLNGLLLPSQGKVLVDGFPTIDAARVVQIRRRVGMIFQDPRHQITSVSVEREIAFGLQNIGLSRDEIRERVTLALERFQLNHLRDRSPSTLSGGELQRVAVASVMALRPAYLVLDEPTSLLSFPSRVKLLEQIVSLRDENHTGLMLITQFHSEAIIADRLIILHEGKVMDDAPPLKVFDHGDALEALGIAVPLWCKVNR